MSALEGVQNIIQSSENQAGVNRIKKQEDQKYQEKLPWISKHISPYIPKLDKVGYQNDYYIPEVKDYEIVNSFQPFFQNNINPVRRQEEDYSEKLKNLDEEDQARYTMNKFREFLAEHSKPELSTESGVLNSRYRNRLMNVIDQYKQGKITFSQAQQKMLEPPTPHNTKTEAATTIYDIGTTKSVQGQTPLGKTPLSNKFVQFSVQTPSGQNTNTNQIGSNYQGQTPIYQSTNLSASNQFQGKLSNVVSPGSVYNSQSNKNNPLLGSITSPGSQYHPAYSQLVDSKANMRQSQSFGTVAQNVQNQLRKDNIRLPLEQINTPVQGQHNQQHQSQQFQNSTIQAQQLKGQGFQQQPLVYQTNDVFNKQLCFDYEKLLLGEGKLKQGYDGQTWNDTNQQYLQKLQEWSSDNDNWIQDQLLEHKDIQTPYYLQPRVFRQVRPIDKIKREIIRTEDGQFIPYENVVERRSVEVMHQRDYLVQPYLMENPNGDYEIINDVFSYDRSFIVEQNPLTKTEILHEYPIYLTEEQLLDFLFQTGIEVKQMQYYAPDLTENYDPNTNPYIVQQITQSEPQQKQQHQQQKQNKQSTLQSIQSSLNQLPPSLTYDDFSKFSRNNI